jgi:citrate synthase
LPVAAAGDPRASDISAESVAQTGGRLLRLLAAIVADAEPSPRPIDAVLAEAWGVGASLRGLLRAALILCADHEFNVSAFTARCVASAQASPYNSVLAGMAALQGAWHGGMTERADAFLADAFAAPDMAAFCAARLRLGERLPGFGHPLYPLGDPRAKVLLDLLATSERPSVAAGLRLARLGGELVGRAPNIDFALALLRHSLGLPAGAALAFFVVGRSMGWIAQALEQYALRQLIRPRARYVGPPVQ